MLDTLVPIMPKKIELMIEIIGDDFSVPRRLILRSTSSILAPILCRKGGPALSRIQTSRRLTGAFFEFSFSLKKILLQRGQSLEAAIRFGIFGTYTSNLEFINVSLTASTSPVVKDIQDSFNGLGDSVGTAVAIPIALVWRAPARRKKRA